MTSSYRKALVLAGAALATCPASEFYGNLLPYIASYHQARRDQMYLYLDPLWPMTAYRCCFSIAMILASPLELRFGMLPCILAGIIFMDISVLSGYLTVDEPLGLTLAFGGLLGLSVGFIYPLTMKLLLQTMQEKGGTATGIMSIGPAVGSLVNIAISFAVINPENKETDLVVGNSVYFSDPDVIRRVPYYFLAMGFFIVCVTSLGFVFMYIGSSEAGQKATEEVSVEKYCLIEDSILSGDEHTEAEPLKHKDQKVKLYEQLIITSENYKDLEKIQYSTSDIEAAALVAKNLNHHKNSSKENGPSRALAEAVDLSPRQMLKTGQFWCVWLCFSSLSHTAYLHLTLYKQYGQLAVSNDAVLVTTGLLCTIGMMITRPMTGVSSDKIGIRNTCLAMFWGASLFMSLMVIAIHVAPSLYAILVILEFQCVSSQTLVFGLLTSYMFGKTHCASNMGLVSSGQPFLSVAEPFIVSVMVQHLGWDWVFLSGSLSAVFSVLAIMALDWM